VPSPLDDVKEYEPLFPEEAKESEKPAPEKPSEKARHFFPSKDVWEDAPSSVHYTAEVSTPDEQAEAQKSVDRPKTPAHIFAQKQEELAEQESATDIPKAQEKPIWTESKESDSFLSTKKRPSAGRRFPSRDVWEDVPESQLYEATVSETLEEKPETPEEKKPEIPTRPKKTEDRPAVPDRPKPKKTPSDEGKPKPPVSDKPKPHIPPRPDVKSKPPVPSRPVGNKIAALQAGFMSDLNKRLAIGPQAPKKEEAKPQEDVTEEKEKAPLSDARKGRARGPQRRAPARSPAAPVKTTGPSLTFSIPQTLWSIDPEGSLSVSGDSLVPETAPETTPETTPEVEAEVKPEAEPEAEPEVKPEEVKPEVKAPEPVEQPAELEPEVPQAETETAKPEPAPEVEAESAEPVPQEPAVEPQPAAESKEPEPQPEAPKEIKPEEDKPAEEKTLVANTAGESILETTVEKKDGAVDPVEVADQVKQ
jgi:hypothetical protein